MCGGVCDGGGGNGVSVGVQGRGDTAGKNSLVVQIPVLEHTTPLHPCKGGLPENDGPDPRRGQPVIREQLNGMVLGGASVVLYVALTITVREEPHLRGGNATMQGDGGLCLERTVGRGGGGYVGTLLRKATPVGPVM